MLKLLFAFLISLLLIGCGRTLADEAHDQARGAFESGDFSHGSLLLAAGCNTLHLQSVYLLRMINYQSSEDLLSAMATWSRIKALDTPDDFVKNVAEELMHEFTRAMISEHEHLRFKLYMLN